MKNTIEIENWNDLCEHVKKFYSGKNFLDSTIVLYSIITDGEKDEKIESMSFSKVSILDKTPLNELIFKTIHPSEGD